MTDSHYFDDDPSIPSDVRQVSLHLADMSLELDVDRGVFSATKIDAGTRVLLVEAAQPGAAKTILDVGCGYGPIACAVARRAPDAAVWAIDVNARARSLCAANAARLGFNITVSEPETVPDELRFDLIVSNPPIRIGKKNLHALLEHWLDRLTPDGTAELVVQKHLGSDSLQRWLNEQGWPTTRLTSRSGYRVLVVKARDTTTSDPANADTTTSDPANAGSSRRRAETTTNASAEGRGTEHTSTSDPANAGSSRRRADTTTDASAEGRGTEHTTTSDPANAGSSRRRAETQ